MLLPTSRRDWRLPLPALSPISLLCRPVPCRGGGSVFLATSNLDWRLLRPCGAERFEDGTLPFLNILGLSYG